MLLQTAESDVRWARGRLSPLSAGRVLRRSYRVPVGTVVQAPLDSLRPTQMAVGMRSVARKLQKLEKRAGDRKRLEKTLQKRPIPAVYGPDGGLFMVDHHHFGMALCLADFDRAYVHVVGDASELSRAAFWKRMEADGRLHPFDERGQRIPPSHLPTSLSELRHDPYRDLAWDVREAGGYEKVAEPYVEFVWANFFRKRITLLTMKRDPKGALRFAMALARSKYAQRLPGFMFS